jgi:hypothetical protein
VPLEGHWQRQHTPLRSIGRRERRLLIAVTLVVVVAAAVTLYLALHHGSGKVTAGCVQISAASTTGGANLHACGADAARWCRSETERGTAGDRAVLAACRRAGYDQLAP